MDSRTVQAFLDYYGFTEAQDPEFFKDDILIRINATPMNMHLLFRRCSRLGEPAKRSLYRKSIDDFAYLVLGLPDDCWCTFRPSIDTDA